ncbi:arylesterase [Thiocystis violascens]|uniref:Lysophospholipase L1-like esterase n=1 Tax=Thiocystis violascens (strain ATCC 17096 / DSM 198 / 6111) TaxID=765911 RepID=I3YDE0_THIV6|nr:arylesterase [Thiocystis violascens]AFL75008.1 lysophospholipase L1-like esterase [Thiocystis violascens DSM 198]
MIRLLLISVLSLPTVVLAQAPIILALGDSLSAGYGLAREDGWVWLLDQRLRQLGLPHQVVNASVSGDTTAGGLTRLPSLLEQHRPEVMVIELGANDGLRGLDVQVIRDNLTALIRQARAVDSRILLVGVRLPPNYGAAYTNEFQGVFQTVSKAEGVALVPDLLQDVAEHWDLMQPDGIHPTAEAQGRILENVWPVLEPLVRATSGSGS